MMSANVLTLLPEYVMCIAGVVVMLAEPFFKDGASRKVLGWFAILGTIASAGAALYQHGLINQQGTLHAFANTVQADTFSVFFHLVIAAVVLLTLLSSLDYFEGYASHAGEYFALVLFGATGMMLMTSSTELLMVFIGLEISSISTYIMAGFRKGKAASAESAIKYFLLGSFATAFFLYGIALTFGATGTTSIAGIAAGLVVTKTPMLASIAIAMIVIGIGFKVSAAPFHVWTPDVYQGAPAPVVGLMSTAPKAAAFAVLLRILFSGFPAYEAKWSLLIWIIAALSMTIGNLGALMQRDVKRMLAYSSIAHAGYLLAAFVSIPQTAIATAAFYTAAYAVMNVGAFTVLTQMLGFREDARNREDFSGMAQRHPVLAALMALFLLSMIGIPFTAGFTAKFLVFQGTVASGKIWIAVIGLLNSGVALFYYLRLLVTIYSSREAEAVEQSTRRVPMAAVVSLGLSAAAVIALGVMPGSVLHAAQRGGANAATQPLGCDPTVNPSCRAYVISPVR